jgi:hypothetical protein
MSDLFLPPQAPLGEGTHEAQLHGGGVGAYPSTPTLRVAVPLPPLRAGRKVQ